MNQADEAKERGMPGPNEIYCPQCGEITPRNVAICARCDSPLQGAGHRRIPPAKWKRWGRTAVGLSLLVLPLLFAPIAFYCGHKLRRYDEPAGYRIMAYAATATVLWLGFVVVVL